MRSGVAVEATLCTCCIRVKSEVLPRFRGMSLRTDCLVNIACGAVGVAHEPANIVSLQKYIVQTEGRHGNLQKLSETNNW